MTPRPDRPGLTPVPARLYGWEDAESLHADPYSVLEHLGPEDLPRTLVAWSVHPPIDHLPSTDRIIDWFKDEASDGEVDEGWYDSFVGTMESRTMRGYVDAMRRAIATRISYFMADERLGSWPITWDDEKGMLIDGTPSYDWKDPTL